MRRVSTSLRHALPSALYAGVRLHAGRQPAGRVLRRQGELTAAARRPREVLIPASP